MVAAIIRALGIRTCTHTRVYTVFFVMSRESCNCGFHSDNNFLRETVRAPLWRFFELGSMKKHVSQEIYNSIVHHHAFIVFKSIIRLIMYPYDNARRDYSSEMWRDNNYTIIICHYYTARA